MDESCSCACYYNSIACCDTESHSSRESWWTTIHRWVSLPRQCFYYYYTLLLYSPVTSYLLTLPPLGPAAAAAAHSKHTSSLLGMLHTLLFAHAHRFCCTSIYNIWHFHLINHTSNTPQTKPTYNWLIYHHRFPSRRVSAWPMLLCSVPIQQQLVKQ